MDLMRYLEEQEEKALQERARLDQHLEEIRAAKVAVERERLRSDGFAGVGKPTIKEMARIVLAKTHISLSAEFILREINNQFGVEVARTSLSPQLSRLKSDGIVELDEDTGHWSLADVGKNRELRRRYATLAENPNTERSRLLNIHRLANENG